ncbi:MAG: response regulator [bacterium]|nr:response regulator [bacterium]
MRHASRDPYFPIVALAGIAITEIAIRWFYPVKPFTRQLIAYISPWYVPALFTVLGVQTPLMFVFFMAACLPMLGTLELREVVTSVVYMGLFSAVFHNSIILPGGVTAIVSSMLAFLVALAWASWHHQSASRLEYDELKQQHNAVTIEKETLEEELRHAQKMEAIGLLASGVAHDFNNFLMTINGHSELALATIDPGDPAVDHFKAIKEAGERAASLTKQLLTFSRKQVNNPQILHVNDILAIQRKFLPRLIGENIKVIVEPDEEVKPILADPGLLEQAILNLALNARDAMPEGGRLTIRSYAQAVTASSKPAGILIEPGDYSVIEVEDEGVGIVPENRERIFDPFFTTKPKGKGTGLGLSTVYGFLQKCGGGVRVESEPGRGSIFSLYFPSIDHPANGFEKIEVNVERYQGSETILLVEDDPNVRALTRKSLEAYRYRVIEMENGAEALQFFGSGPHNIDLVLTDIVMPGISGKRLAEEVRRLIPGIKIVYMSGYTDNQLSEKDLSVKGCAFLQKPFNQSALLKTIRDVLSSA